MCPIVFTAEHGVSLVALSAWFPCFVSMFDMPPWRHLRKRCLTSSIHLSCHSVISLWFLFIVRICPARCILMRVGGYTSSCSMISLSCSIFSLRNFKASGVSSHARNSCSWAKSSVERVSLSLRCFSLASSVLRFVAD